MQQLSIQIDCTLTPLRSNLLFRLWIMFFTLSNEVPLVNHQARTCFFSFKTGKVSHTAWPKLLDSMCQCSQTILMCDRLVSKHMVVETYVESTCVPSRKTNREKSLWSLSSLGMLLAIAYFPLLCHWWYFKAFKGEEKVGGELLLDDAS